MSEVTTYELAPYQVEFLESLDKQEELANYLRTIMMSFYEDYERESGKIGKNLRKAKGAASQFILAVEDDTDGDPKKEEVWKNSGKTFDSIRGTYLTYIGKHKNRNSL